MGANASVGEKPPKVPLQSKVVIVTGGSSGIGYAAAKMFAEWGAQVIIASRNSSKAQAAVTTLRQETGNALIQEIQLDLASPASIQQFVSEFKALNTGRLDILVNNAALFPKQKVVGVSGVEQSADVNHFGHFLLTLSLMDVLQATKGSRVVVVTCDMSGAKLDLNDLAYNKGTFNSRTAFVNSKLMNALFANEFSRRLKQEGVTSPLVVLVHPGHTASDIGSLSGGCVGCMPKAPDVANALVFASTAPSVKPGEYYKAQNRPSDQSSIMNDVATAARLWELSEKVTGAVYSKGTTVITPRAVVVADASPAAEPASAEPEGEDEPAVLPVDVPAGRPARRAAVSAEAGHDTDSYRPTVVHAKSDEERAVIKQILSQNMLFKDLTPEAMNSVIDAMECKKFEAGDQPITQGDEGDLFYVVQSGDFTVIKDGKEVGSIHANGSFGELALMYGQPRAATIKASTAAVTWVVDRVTFQYTMRSCFEQERNMYESFLENVELFRLEMAAYDRARLADAFETRDYADGEVVVKEGDTGDSFFVIREGEAVVTKGGEVVNDLREDSYFGELALLFQRPRAATVTAKGPLKCAVLSADAFERLVPQDVKEKMRHEAENYNPGGQDRADTEAPSSPPMRAGRRTAVSAESGMDASEAIQRPKVYHEKSADDRQNIERILRGTLLFRDLAQEHLTAVVDAMERREFNVGDQPITQGDEGDVFYVVQSGDFTFIKDGKEVGKVGANGSFGELALMYSQPRAATVRADSAAVTWAVDRGTFTSVLMKCFQEQRNMYEGFLEKVSIIRDNLDKHERARLADAFETRDYADGEVVVKEGDTGDSFFVIREGEAVVTKVGTELQKSKLQAGDYFGELALLKQQPRAATITAQGPLKCAVLPADAFERLIPDTVKASMRVLADSYEGMKQE